MRKHFHIMNQARTQTRFWGCGTPESGPFGPNPPHKTQFLAHFVAKSGPFGRLGGCIAPPAPPLTTGLSWTFKKCICLYILEILARYILKFVINSTVNYSLCSLLWWFKDDVVNRSPEERWEVRFTDTHVSCQLSPHNSWMHWICCYTCTCVLQNEKERDRKK